MSGPRSRRERVAAVVAATLDQSAGGFRNALRGLRNDWRTFASVGNRSVSYTVTALVPEPIAVTGRVIPEGVVGKYGVSVSEAGVHTYFRAFATRRGAKAKAVELWRKAKERFDTRVRREQTAAMRKQTAAMRKLETRKRHTGKRRAAASDPQRRLQHAQAMLRRADTRVKRAVSIQRKWKQKVEAARKAVERSK